MGLGGEARAKWVIAAVALSLMACGRFCNDDADLVGGERELGQVEVGDATLTVRAELGGSYRRERIGGGRVGTHITTSDEIWGLHVDVSSSGDQAMLVDSQAGWQGDAGEQAHEVLDGLGLEQCADRSTAVYRVTGFDERPWHVVHAGPGQIVVAEIDAGGDDCAQVLAAAPSASAVLQRLQERGLEAVVDRNEEQPPELSPTEANAVAAGHRRSSRLALEACAAMLQHLEACLTHRLRRVQLRGCPFRERTRQASSFDCPF